MAKKAKPVKEDSIRCRCCGKTNKECGHSLEDLYSLSSYFEGTYICKGCIEEAGAPVGNGLDLQQRVLILLSKDTDFGI